MYSKKYNTKGYFLALCITVWTIWLCPHSYAQNDTFSPQKIIDTTNLNVKSIQQCQKNDSIMLVTSSPKITKTEKNRAIVSLLATLLIVSSLLLLYNVRSK